MPVTGGRACRAQYHAFGGVRKAPYVCVCVLFSIPGSRMPCGTIRTLPPLPVQYRSVDKGLPPLTVQ